MSDGIDCICGAQGESECGCGADWTPHEVYELREENKMLREMLKKSEWVNKVHRRGFAKPKQEGE